MPKVLFNAKPPSRKGGKLRFCRISRSLICFTLASLRFCGLALKSSQAVHNAMDTVPYPRITKINNERQFQIHKTQIGKCLSLKDAIVDGDGLYFYYDDIVHQEVKPERGRKGIPLVCDRDVLLPLNL